MPVDRIVAPGHDRERSLGWLATRWVEFFVLHGPGDIQGTSMNMGLLGAIPLSDELVELTVDVYALGEDGRRLYDSAFFSRPKGADKSGHAGRIALLEALGPCRFGGWAKGGEVFEQLDFRYVYEPGEPMGHFVTHPFVRILATEEEQAGNVYDTVYYNLTDGPLRELFARKDDVGLTRVHLPGGGEIRPSTASNAAKDGGLETFSDFDETHLYVTPELRRMHATVRRNLTKRQEAEGWSFESSTMYAPGQNSIAELSHERANLIREGKLKEPRAYFNHRQAPAGVDLTSEESLRAGLIEAYGDAASYLDIDRKIAEIWDPVNDPADSIRYYLNQVNAFSTAWIAPQEWDALASPSQPVAGSLVTLGLDGNVVRDTTALIGCDVETGHLFVVEIWDPADHEGEVPRPLVDAAVTDAFKRWDVVGFYANRQSWSGYIDQWETRYVDTLCTHVTRRHPIQWDMSGRRTDEDESALGGKKAVVQAAEDFRAAIVEGSRMVLGALDDEERAAALASVPLTHDGDRVFRQHVVNARRRPMPGMGVTFGKEHAGSERVVDAARAATLARQSRQDYVALPDAKKRQRVAEVSGFFA